METDSTVLQSNDLNSYIGKQLFRLDSHLPKDVFIHVLNIFRHQIMQSFLKSIEDEIQVGLTTGKSKLIG